jgi:hypothetical protein
MWTALAVYAVGFVASFALACMQGGTERDDPPFEWRLCFAIATLWPVIFVVAIVKLIKGNA